MADRQPQRCLLSYNYSDLINQSFFSQQLEIMKKAIYTFGD